MSRKQYRFCSIACAVALNSGKRLGYTSPAQAPIEHPTLRDITWAAGIFEGEGYCTAGRRPGRDNGSTRVQVSQKDPWLLHRMQRLFGGGISAAGRAEVGYVGQWWLTGARARGFLMTIYALLSPRRQEQVRHSLPRR